MTRRSVGIWRKGRSDSGRTPLTPLLDAGHAAALTTVRIGRIRVFVWLDSQIDRATTHERAARLAPQILDHAMRAGAEGQRLIWLRLGDTTVHPMLPPQLTSQVPGDTPD